MGREVCKFLSGACAGLAYTHVAYAVAVSAGVMSEPKFRGRPWGVRYAVIEAVVYAAAGLGFGYAGWKQVAQEEPEVRVRDNGRADLSPDTHILTVEGTLSGAGHLAGGPSNPT